MGLIFVTYFFTAVLLFNSLYLSARRSNYVNILLNKIEIPAAFASLAIAISIHLIFYGQTGIQQIVSYVALLLIVSASYYIVDMSFALANQKQYPVRYRLNQIFHIGGAIFAVFFTGRFQWNILHGFSFTARPIAAGVDGITIFFFLYLCFTPALSIAVLLIRVFFVKNNIHRQQFILHGLAVALGAAVWLVIAFLFPVFSWTFALLPLGYIVMLEMDNVIFALTRVFDLKQVGLGFVRFVLFTVLFSALAGFLTALFMQFFQDTIAWIAGISGCSIVMLFIRDFVAGKLNRILGKTADYEETLNTDLQSLDYTHGHDDLLKTFPAILRRHITCKGLDILVSDENMNLQTVYSDFDHHHTMSAGLPCFEYLLNKNVIVVTKSELIANYLYEDMRDDLLGIFETMHMEILIMIREGQKLIGCILLAAKTHSAEYSPYDIHVLSNMYAYFFLVIYYLRNITKQALTVTVDREIEMSDQIIGSIQRYKDSLEARHFSMESVSYSAHQLGGDFIDYITLNEQRALFLIGDVSGKGLSASMSMVILKSVIHTYLQEITDFKELVVKVNRFVKCNLPRGTFFAGLFGIIDFPSNTIYYLNCGIPLMSMYISSYRNAIGIQGEGKVLGFVKDISPFLKVRKITMNKGDVIVLTTDGLLDATNLKGDRFGSDRVNRILQDNNAAQSSQIARTIYNSLLDFILRKIEDDVTILVLKYDE